MMNEAVIGIEAVMMRFSEVTSTKLRALRESQLRTDQKLAETNDRLKTFVEVVEEIIDNGRKSIAKKSKKKPVAVRRNDRD